MSWSPEASRCVYTAVIHYFFKLVKVRPVELAGRDRLTETVI